MKIFVISLPDAAERRGRKQRVAARGGDYTLWRYTGVPHSCMCNSMTPEVAQNLVEQTRSMIFVSH